MPVQIAARSVGSVVLLFGVVSAFAAEVESPQERAKRALDQPAVMSYVDTPLKDIFAHLAKVHRVPIKINRGTAEEPSQLWDSVGATFNIRDVSLRSALNLLLDPRQVDYRVTDAGQIELIASGPDSLSKRPISKVQDAGNWRNFRKLETAQVRLEFIDLPLRDIVAALAEEVGTAFFLDHDALAVAGLEKDTPLSINTGPLPLHRALTALLTPYDLRVALRNEVFYITARDERLPRREIPAELYKLASTPVEIDFRELPFWEVHNHLAALTKQPVFLDHRRVFAELKIASNEQLPRITTPRQRIPLREAYRQILEPLGLRVVVYNEVLFITPLKHPRR